MTVAVADDVTPDMLAARERLRARMGVSGTQTGGKGTARRKMKKTSKLVGDDKRLQFGLRSIGAANIPGIEEVQMIKNDGHVLIFSNPKVQAAPNANTYVISGVEEEREISLPDILQQLSAAGINLPQAGNHADQEGDIPQLVEGFDSVAQKGEEEAKIVEAD
ncbi:nascent polypeptide-associated complex (NAC) domain family protein [Babesia bovis T2Bo]|uniref:Nascent polypeptide-associated complex subunit beta n=1 Tax=Babesia bovis TaxID=5865 RepID=A7APX1_BABBO|nr:nascent polypeptide-associated complex (NAC) domain family protein [Babesia bovis T2Bo]EDO08605.1 nascent polypeptide-associated complex (NAC) domain family protein [Babesia bovis T2Bo]BAN64245.1 NAC domain containing protein [Babesia bovis]|eukprot:XP_001612173.1 NAC domain containing protein [Babesia bovis T2Bo]